MCRFLVDLCKRPECGRAIGERRLVICRWGPGPLDPWDWSATCHFDDKKVFQEQYRHTQRYRDSCLRLVKWRNQVVPPDEMAPEKELDLEDTAEPRGQSC